MFHHSALTQIWYRVCFVYTFNCPDGYSQNKRLGLRRRCFDL